MRTLRRIVRHWMTPPVMADRAFTRRTREAVQAAIAEIEKACDVVLRIKVEASLPMMSLLRGESARVRAVQQFRELGVWDTEHNSGVLIYVQLADRRIEIVADRGINAKVAQKEWNAICRKITRAFAKGDYEGGTMLGIAEISALLRTHVPAREDAR